MKTKQPSLPLKVFADRRKKKKPITPENQAKMAADEKRRVDKLHRDDPPDPRYASLALAALAVESRRSSTAGLIEALLGIGVERDSPNRQDDFRTNCSTQSGPSTWRAKNNRSRLDRFVGEFVPVGQGTLSDGNR
jgi:hypothetical protein